MFTSENRIIVFSHVAAIWIASGEASVFLAGGKVLELREKDTLRFVKEFKAWAALNVPQVEAVK